MGITDLFSDLFSTFAITEAHAEAPSEGQDESLEESSDEGKGEESSGDSEGAEDDGEEDGGEEEEEEEEEPEDAKPKLEEECANSKLCAPFKHHFDECVERVTEASDHADNKKGPHEDCVEEWSPPTSDKLRISLVTAASGMVAPPNFRHAPDPSEVATYISEISSALREVPRLHVDGPLLRERDRAATRAHTPRFKGGAAQRRSPQGAIRGPEARVVISPETNTPAWEAFATWEHAGDGDEPVKRRLLWSPSNLGSAAPWNGRYGRGRVAIRATTSEPEASWGTNACQSASTGASREPNDPTANTGTSGELSELPTANVEATATIAPCSTTHLEEDTDMLKSFVDRVKAERVAKAAEGGRRGPATPRPWRLEPPRAPLAELDRNPLQKATNNIAADATTGESRLTNDGHGEPSNGTPAQEPIQAGPKSILKVKESPYGEIGRVHHLAKLTKRITHYNTGVKYSASQIPWGDYGPWPQPKVPKPKSVTWSKQLTSCRECDYHFETLNSSCERGTAYLPQQQLRVKRRLRECRVLEQPEREQKDWWRVETDSLQPAKGITNGLVSGSTFELRTGFELEMLGSQPVEEVGVHVPIAPEFNVTPGPRARYESETEFASTSNSSVPSGGVTRISCKTRPRPEVHGAGDDKSKRKRKVIVMLSSELASSSKRRELNLKLEVEGHHELTIKRRETVVVKRAETGKEGGHDAKTKAVPPSRIPSRQGASKTAFRKPGITTRERRRRSLRLEELAHSRQ
ncbi:MAG: ubiquinol--cytochrome-c reductase subunit 6 [Geoglossum umbratile]|nr:MAG: ubiquinol--cytochrome-c reductase subunit 6 [Geoglossum umbratile]